MNLLSPIKNWLPSCEKMASYKIEWKKSAAKELRRLDREAIPGIVKTVEDLAANPFPHESRKIRGSEHTYRIRLGDYRIIYSVRSKLLSVEVLGVGHRKDIYRKLA